jgi:hypothetical protein
MGSGRNERLDEEEMFLAGNQDGVGYPYYDEEAYAQEDQDVVGYHVEDEDERPLEGKSTTVH